MAHNRPTASDDESGQSSQGDVFDMSSKDAVKEFAKKVIPERYHPYVRARMLPVITRIKDYWATSMFANNRSELYSQVQEVLERSRETDRMILGMLKVSQLGGEQSHEVLSKLDLILEKLGNMEAQSRETDKILLEFIKVASITPCTLMTGDDKKSHEV